MADQESDPTRTSDRATSSPPAAGAPASGYARFAPGVVLAGRYRIVSLLARGGMGEVYRADDLKLDQPVALKFLPERLAADPSRRARFLNEVRVARQVTHPNVCRVHDVGEAQGQHFLSMEYVDGEDLASFLRRAGRLSLEKGVELARQICLGLAAAHDRGVLHRDLKPANVMVDGRGRARLTDFGLAMATGEAARSGEIAGTAAYMAPEQIEGKGVSERSDVYALGLVLYEMFTGRPAFLAPTVQEIVRQQLQAVPPSPSSHATGFDPALERLILRCLEKDPARRPASAIAVAAALPGGDPLAALVAAGETPPPELVAAAGTGGRVALGPAWAAFGVVLLGLPVGLGLLERITILHGVPLDKPPEVLLERAREAARIARPEPGASSAWGFEHDPAAPPAERVRLWYREAPGRLDAVFYTGRVDPDDPPLGPGMVLVRVDTDGRLRELVAVPETDAAAAAGAPEWSVLLRLAGVEPASLRPAEPTRLPPVFADRREAWLVPDGRRLQGAGLGPRPVFLTLLPAPRPASRASRATVAFVVIWATSLAFAVVLATRNLSRGRGDRQGALRIGLWAAASRLGAWALQAPHSADLDREQTLLILAIGRALFSGSQLWLLYLAIEPAIRRRWPACLVSWTRLLQGRWRDPLVGRDLLGGIAGATAMGLCWGAARVLSPGAAPVPVQLGFLRGLREFGAWLLVNQIQAIMLCLLLLVMGLLLRLLFRDLRVALGVTTLLFTAIAGVNVGFSGSLEFVAAGLVSLLLLFLMLRFGALAVVTVTFFLGAGQLAIPATLALGSWYGATALAWLLTGYAMAAFGLYTATGGRPLPKAGLLDD
jgi:serine/threonine-protein kinase